MYDVNVVNKKYEKGVCAIGTLVTYHNGSLLRRLEEVDKAEGHAFPVYDQYMFEYDKGEFDAITHEPKYLYLKANHNAKLVHTGDIVLNMMSGECVIVSERHEGSVLPYNYTHIEVDATRLDAAYFAYWFNASKSAKSQLHQILQGGSLVKKLTLQHLKQLDIDCPPIEKQRHIGTIAEKRKALKYLKAKRDYQMDIYLAHTLFGEE